MNILLTSSRMPYALPEIRYLGRAGHAIHATDSFSTAPGNHSRFVVQRHVTRSPRYESESYLRDIESIVQEHSIELVLPMFEEVFYLLRGGPVIGGRAPVFAPDFDTLVRLHDKRRFTEFAEDVGVATPATTIAWDIDELRAAIREHDRYFARPAFSRGGVTLLTNHGPLAGAVDLDACVPTLQNPWIVQEYVDGSDVCSFSVVRDGKVRAHATYEHPKTIESAGGIVFESVDEPGTLEIVQRIAEATRYDGQLSLDFMRLPDGRLLTIECNPRPTAGVAVMPEAMFVDAVLGPADGPIAVAPAGQHTIIRSALLREMFMDWHEILDDLRKIFSSARDLYFDESDYWPGIYQFLSLSQVWAYRFDVRHYERSRSDLLMGYLHDASWNGEPGLPAGERALGPAPSSPPSAPAE